MTIFKDNDTLILHASNNGGSVSPPKGVIQLNIPMGLIKGIDSVTAVPINESYPAGKNISDSLIKYQIHSDYKGEAILANISIEKTGDFKISARGTLAPLD